MPSTTLVSVYRPHVYKEKTGRRHFTDTFNARNEDVVLVAVTSQIAHNAATVSVRRRDVEDGSLPKDSIVRLAKIFTLHSSLVVKRLCRLKAAKKDELLRELRAFFL